MRYIDNETKRVADMKRRVFMLRRHASLRDPVTGKSALAERAGRLGGLRTAYKLDSPSAWGLSMALWRWHRVPLQEKLGTSVQRGGEMRRHIIALVRRVTFTLFGDRAERASLDELVDRLAATEEAQT